ncbi:MAG: hypothetical protein V7L11_17045 [Nostoc sp.]|uniref:hypothetical protein n=1 Tax=Nostoc sp. TaxID=1180 RepID=UPI002FF7ED44
MFTLALLVVMALLPILLHKERSRKNQPRSESQRSTLALLKPWAIGECLLLLWRSLSLVSQLLP